MLNLRYLIDTARVSGMFRPVPIPAATERENLMPDVIQGGYILRYLPVLIMAAGFSGCSLITPTPVTYQEKNVTEDVCSCQQGLYPLASSKQIMEIQARLIVLGYRAGEIDGLPGKMTTRAIREYQSGHNLLTDGRPSPELLEHIKQSDKTVIYDQVFSRTSQ